MESDIGKKTDLLTVAISAIEKCVKTSKSHFETRLGVGQFVFGEFGEFYTKFGRIYYYLYSITKETEV